MWAKAARGGCGRRGKEVMCGIVGFASKKADYDKQAVLKEMMDRIAHRGPDGEGSYLDVWPWVIAACPSSTCRAVHSPCTTKTAAWW